MTGFHTTRLICFHKVKGLVFLSPNDFPMNFYSVPDFFNCLYSVLLYRVLVVKSDRRKVNIRVVRGLVSV